MSLKQESPKLSNTMLPVLLVCFSRPTNLLKVLSLPEMIGREVFIYIDKAEEFSRFRELNNQVIAIANGYTSLNKANVKISQINQGVSRAVPSAISWALEMKNEIIILEDDCIPKIGALKFFDQNIHVISHDVVMISGYGFENELIGSGSNFQYSFTMFPMIWGWATNKTSWNLISKILNNPPIFRKMCSALIKYPNRLISICFFYAAYIRVSRGLMQAWDAPIALEMLISNYKCALSKVNFIENIGDDDVSSHKMEFKKKTYIEDGEDIDKFIKSKVYKMRIRHVLSPFKAIINF